MILKRHEEVGRRFILVLGTLAGIDMLLIGLSVSAAAAAIFWGRYPADHWFITNDNSFGEQFGYLKFLLSSVICVALWWRPGSRRGIYLALAFVFLILAADDALQLHERGGAWLVQHWNLDDIFGLRPAAYTSVMVMGALALAMLLALAAGFLRSTPSHRRLGRAILDLLVAMAFFAVIVDFLGVVAESIDHETLRRVVIAVLGTIEDGGEMIIASIILAFLVALWRAPQDDQCGVRHSGPCETRSSGARFREVSE